MSKNPTANVFQGNCGSPFFFFFLIVFLGLAAAGFLTPGLVVALGLRAARGRGVSLSGAVTITKLIKIAFQTH